MSSLESKFSIKNWSESDRPREKLVAQGKKILSNAELMAILIGSGSRSESAVSLCKRILASVGNNLNEVAKLNVQQLTNFKGIGDAKAISIVAALELGRRQQAQAAPVQPTITSSKDVYNYMQPLLGNLNHEEFWVLFLNNSNKVVHRKMISSGGQTGTVVDIRLILKTAFEFGAVAMILAHNHPSGSLRPSQADKTTTINIAEAGKTVTIKVLDHLIVTEKNYFSFADEGLM